jgi:itaconate CoA-transferase
MGPPFVHGESALYLGLNRNKESLVVDYTQAKGLALLRALIPMADVLVVDLLPAERRAYQVTYAPLAPPQC